MKKKGFTLVELLAVIAILAILVIVALPNVMGMFNSAKKSSFETELKNILSTAQQQYMQDQISQAGGTTNITRTYALVGETATSTGEGVSCGNGGNLDLQGRKTLYYVITFNTGGKVTRFVATDGSFQYDSNTQTDLKPEAITGVQSLSDEGVTSFTLHCNGRQVDGNGNVTAKGTVTKTPTGGAAATIGQ